MIDDVVVIGAGFAGLSAALALTEAGGHVTLLEALGPGGELLNIPHLTGRPAGPDLAAALLERALTAGVDVRFDEAVAVRVGEVDTALSGPLAAPAVVLAMGAEPLRLGIRGEAELAGRGVSYCVGCDAGLFRGVDTVVLAGGPYAAAEAAHLATVAATVALVAPGPADELAGVRVLRDARALRVEGDDRVSGVTIAIGDREETLAARGVFVCAGAAPRTALVDGVVELGPAGGVVTDGARTSVPGIYAIGDVRAGASQRLDAITADVDALVEALA